MFWKLCRSCHWEWMANNSCLCQCWGLLSDWASNWMHPRIQNKRCGCCKFLSDTLELYNFSNFYCFQRKMLISSSPSLCSGNMAAFNHIGHCANNSPDHSYSQDYLGQWGECALLFSILLSRSFFLNVLLIVSFSLWRWRRRSSNCNRQAWFRSTTSLQDPRNRPVWHCFLCSVGWKSCSVGWKCPAQHSRESTIVYEIMHRGQN